MPMNDRLAEALNAQITHEFNASYIYLGMSAYFESLDLDGFAGWMRAQSAEEWGHGMRIFDHLAARDVDIVLAPLVKPKTGYDDPKAAIASPAEAAMGGDPAAALAAEQGNTRAVNALYAKAIECGDYQAKSLMDWFVNEQIEEEDTVRTLLSQLKIAGSDGAALLILDPGAGRSAISGGRGGNPRRAGRVDRRRSFPIRARRRRHRLPKNRCVRHNPAIARAVPRSR